MRSDGHTQIELSQDKLTQMRSDIADLITSFRACSLI